MRSRSIGESRRVIIIGILLIILLSALSYLLLARNFGFYNDDWYLVYAGLVGGSSKFIDVFAIDRPFRAYFVGFIFRLLGLNAPLYSYVTYFLRTAGAVGMFWLLWQLWPGKKQLAALLSALFVIYPGWTDQPTAFDYQSHLLSFALVIFSLALTIQAWRETRVLRRILWIGLGVVFQITSLLLMEYYIGLEALRFALLLYLAADREPFNLLLRGGWTRLLRSVLAFLPYLAGAGAFLSWRLFIFTNTRSTTDIGGMFEKILQAPLHRGLVSLVYLVQDFLNVTLLAWFVPLYQSAYGLRLRDSLVTLCLGFLAAGLVWLGWKRMRASITEPSALANGHEGRDMFWLGTLGVVFSLVPVILGDRHIIFPDFSRFSLPGSIGAMMIIGGFLQALQHESKRVMVISVLAGLAVMAQYSNSVNYANRWEAMRNFWWQVSWRAPQIAPETVLVAQYSSGSVNEDYFVWGPANLVYYPEPYEPEGKTRTPLAAVVLTSDTIQAIQMGIALPERERRGIISTQDLGQTLVMSMPESSSCVHIFDGKQPELSQKEDYRIMLTAGNSDINRILVGESFHTPPSALFGKEPPHEWCYYFQKASLARQRGDWEEVARLGDEAMALSMHPVDRIEWVPFIEAYAYLGRYDTVNRLYPILADVRYLKYEICNLFSKELPGKQGEYREGQKYLQDTFCH